MSMRFDSSSLRVLCISAFLVTFVATSYAGVQVTASGGNVRDSGGAIIGTFTTSSGGAVFTFSDLNGNTSDWDWSGYTKCYWHALTHDYYLIVEAVRDPDTGDLLVGRVRNSFQLFAGDGGEVKALRRGVLAIRRGDATMRSSVSAPDN